MSERAASDAPRIAVIADSPAASALLREVLATTLPGVETQAVDPSATVLALERTHGAVIDAEIGGQSGLAVLRRMRASGYGGAAVLLVETTDPDAPVARDAATLGARCIARDEVVASLGQTVAEAVAAPGESPWAEAVRAALRRSQRLMAAGEIALSLQHAMNNPLGALLAEAQLLEMEPLADEQKESVRRMLELLRRVIALVRQLDGVGGRKADGSTADAQPGGGTSRCGEGGRPASGGSE